MKTSCAWFAIFSALLLVTPSFSWGTVGHAIIGDVAQSLLTAAASNGIRKYLATGATLASIASVADTYRSSNGGGWTSPLHFTDYLRNQTEYNERLDCSGGCVTLAITNYTNRLRGVEVDNLPPLRGVSAADLHRGDHEVGTLHAFLAEPNALEFLVHFVGDVHQPLHAGWADDLGGNQVSCTWFGGSNTNLHSVWDSSFISRYNNDYVSFSTELKNTIKANPSLITRYTASLNPITWTNESFNLTRTQVYNFGTDGTRLNTWYYNNNLQTQKDRLIAAGIRLSAVLNNILT